MTQMNWQSTLALQGLHRAQEPTYDLYALVNWQRQLKTNWTTHTECFLFLWLLQSKYDGGYFTQIRPDRTRPIQSRLVLHYRAECDTVSRYLTYYLSGMFWREMSLVSLDTVNNHLLVRAHGPGSCVKKKNYLWWDFGFFKNPKEQHFPITGLWEKAIFSFTGLRKLLKSGQKWIFITIWGYIGIEKWS